MSKQALRELIAKVPHEADLSSTQGFPSSVVFVNSKDYPCKPDCTRCGLEAAYAAGRAASGAQSLCPLHGKTLAFCADCHQQFEYVTRKNDEFDAKREAAPAMVQCKCYEYINHEYAPAILGLPTRWMVTENCPMHRKATALSEEQVREAIEVGRSTLPRDGFHSG